MLFMLFIIVGGFGFFVVKTYNHLQGRSHEVREAHSNIVVSMKKRIDLANKLIDIASSYGDHEKLTHISIAKADSDTAVIAASAEVAGALNHVVKLATVYPELKASETYSMLMRQLEDVESNLQDRRERYNAFVRGYNTKLSQLPTNLFAPALGFRSAPYFNVDDADSLDALKDFSSADGEILRGMLADAGRKRSARRRTLAGRWSAWAKTRSRWVATLQTGTRHHGASRRVIRPETVSSPQLDLTREGRPTRWDEQSDS